MSNAPWQPVPHETPIDPSDLTELVRAYGVKTRAELSVLEAENIAPVIIKYLSAAPSTHLAPFDYSWVVSLHKEMFGDVMKSAGMIRQVDLNLGDPHYNVRGNLYGLVEDLCAWPGLGMPLLDQAVRLHLRAVKIHPFLNGNGRWSRMLANIWLKQNGAAPIHWPEEVIGCESVIRTEYINAIKAADAGDLTLLTALHEKYQGSSH